MLQKSAQKYILPMSIMQEVSNHNPNVIVTLIVNHHFTAFAYCIQDEDIYSIDLATNIGTSLGVPSGSMPIGLDLAADKVGRDLYLITFVNGIIRCKFDGSMVETFLAVSGVVDGMLDQMQ